MTAGGMLSVALTVPIGIVFWGKAASGSNGYGLVSKAEVMQSDDSFDRTAIRDVDAE